MLSIQTEPVRIDAGPHTLDGMLGLPEEPVGVILFVSTSNHSRVKPPNDYVACMLRTAHLGTLWLDLAPAAGSAQRQPDIEDLAERLKLACAWLRQHETTRELPLGLFGAGPGSAATLQVAAALGRGICALVLRGGRPELVADGTLARISAPTLLIVGGLDDGAVDTNRAAYAALRCKKRFEIIPGATPSFEEAGNLEVVARLSRGWFLQHADAAPR